MKRLEGEALTGALERLPGWSLDAGAVVRTFGFPDFVAAMRFVNDAAALAEQMNHHPDLDIRYNKVRVALVTHDAGGVTERDIEQASRLSEMSG